MRAKEVAMSTPAEDEVPWSIRKEIEFSAHFTETRPVDNRVFWGGVNWTDLAIFAFSLATGFDLPFLGSDNNEEDFARLNDRLDAISAKLDGIVSDVHAVLARIEALPEAVRGVVDQAFLKSAVLKQQTHVQLLRPYLKDQPSFMAEGNFNIINQLLIQLAEDIGQIIGFTTGGMGGVGMSTAGVAVWCQAKTMLLNKRDTNPSGRTIWDEEFFTSIAQMIEAFFGAADRTLVQYSTDAPNVPGSCHGDWQFHDDAFHPYSYPDTVPYVADVFTVSSPTPSHAQRRLLCSVPHNGSFDPFPPPLLPGTYRHHFALAEGNSLDFFEHPAVVRAAGAAWTGKYRPYLQQMNVFNAAFKDYPNLRDQVRAAMKRPSQR